MAVLSFSFDGEGLVYARLTRHVRGSRAYVTVGEPTPSGSHATAARITGLDAAAEAGLRVALERQYGRSCQVVRDGGALVAHVLMPASQLWPTRLHEMRGLERHVWPPLVRIEAGRVHVFAQPRPGVDVPTLARQVAAMLDAPVATVPEPEIGPWTGLIPMVPM